MRVFLLHGMARTAASMALLGHRLRRAGHQTQSFGYHVTFETLHGIADRLVARVRETIAADAAAAGCEVGEVPYAVIGHSLGNVIARLAASRLPPGLAALVMLAPPNESPAVARKLESNWLYQRLTRDAGQKLADPSFYAELPRPPVPILVVAGTAGSKARWLPFEGEPNDGIVKVAETRLEGAELLEIRGVHTFLMNRQDVFQAALDFLARARSQPR